MRAYGKDVVVGMQVSLKANPYQVGSILRIYPFNDKPNIMVKWKSGCIKSFNLKELRV